jgi:hypothetical protein
MTERTQGRFCAELIGVAEAVAWVASLIHRHECTNEPRAKNTVRFTRDQSAITHDFVRRRAAVPDAAGAVGARGEDATAVG